MSALEVVVVLAAGLAAGTINGVIGSGTLITFPVLLSIGFSPVVANVTNTVGLAPGSATAVYGYREQLAGRWRWALGYAAASACGAVAGAILLLTLPASAFRVVVPVLISAALVLVVLQPRIARRVLARREAGHLPNGRILRGGIGLTGLYGGYFGAAQGVLLFALLGTAIPEDLQRVNALRNLLAGTANGTAAIVFLAVADVELLAALLIALGAMCGGLLGARIGKRLPEPALRALVVVVGVVAIVRVLA
ncbi:putative membrane transporter protein YfcA [Paraconexibacter sp. AEG42_29]|uniref:Probable membrane transporter protein n=1 Tax=Paraconexibacter sp. AEG42_29 TaxID=2997339 RepID=A0AAU7B3E4_9ACTN